MLKSIASLYQNEQAISSDSVLLQARTIYSENTRLEECNRTAQPSRNITTEKGRQIANRTVFVRFEHHYTTK